MFFKVVRFFRKWWWMFLLGAGVIFSVLWKLLKVNSGIDSDTSLEQPTFADKARDKVEKVHLEGEIEKAKVRAIAAEDKKVIAAIEEKGKSDPVVARKEIADWLASNL